MSCCGDVMEPFEASSCCTPQDSAARDGADSDCVCAPVVEDDESRRLLGIVTERDVGCGVAANDRNASEGRVEEIMRQASACCHLDELTDAAQRRLGEQRATSLPVVDEAGCCCGTISLHHLERP